MPDLAQLIGEARAGWVGPMVEQSIFGTSAADDVATIIAGWCARHLGSPVVDGLFYAASVGCVAGVELLDGHRVAVKAFQPRWTKAYLDAMQAAQFALVAGGMPCPVPIALPQPCALGHAVADTMLADPGPNAYEPALVGPAAAGLAELVARCEDVPIAALDEHPLVPASDRLFPVPHSPLIDFAATEPVAGWIHAFAAGARAARDADRSIVVGHTDWTLRNVRYGGGRVQAIYDLDSLAAVAETTIVGQAAVSWSWHDGDGADPPLPGPALAAEFIEHYERARGQRFTSGQHVAIGGAALWLLAYRARCELALDPAGERESTGARAALRAHGAKFLHA